MPIFALSVIFLLHDKSAAFGAKQTLPRRHSWPHRSQMTDGVEKGLVIFCEQ
jgi:hypothetical protein